MSPHDSIIVRDRFTDSLGRGRVVGSTSGDSAERVGVDKHRSLSVDGGELRITSITRPGWGSTAIAHGPIVEADCLGFGAWILNGHNTAQAEPLGESLRTRLKRWLLGNESEPWKRHLWSWVRHGRRAWTLRRFAHWTSIAWSERRGSIVLLDENMSVGLHPGCSSGDPLDDGNSFIMHATGASNGELWVSDVGGPRRCLPTVQNIPLYLFMVRDGDRTIHFAGSIEGVGGLPALPEVRPLAIVATRVADTSYAVVQQAVSGQIGFAADTRVFEMAVASLPVWLRSSGAPVVDESRSDLVSDTERTWTVEDGAGLISVRASPDATVALRWRSHGEGEWLLVASPEHIELSIAENSTWTRIANHDRQPTDAPLDLQVTDDGRRIGIHVGSNLVFGDWITDSRHADATRVKLEVQHGTVTGVTVYRRAVVLPATIRPCEPPTLNVTTAPPLVDDRFDGATGPLETRRVRAAAANWERSAGTGCFEITPGVGARVVATPDKPLAGRTTYTVAHPGGGPVELEIDVLPPGSGRDQGHRGRAGVVFWQDDDNALVVSTWLDDHYSGASISSFFLFDGYEDLYDAIWTNVGRRITWGTPYRLRVAFDGLLFTASVGDEVVLYRRLTDVHPGQQALEINRIGIVANWEWGTDTGSVFRRFTARSVQPVNLVHTTNDH